MYSKIRNHSIHCRGSIKCYFGRGKRPILIKKKFHSLLIWGLMGNIIKYNFIKNNFHLVCRKNEKSLALSLNLFF